MTSVHIIIEITPSFGTPLKIQIFEEKNSYVIQYQGNIHYEEDDFMVTELEKSYQISKEEYKALLGNADKISLNIISDFTTGLDGTTFKVTFQNGFNQTRFCWWADPPKNWEELNNLIKRVIEFIEKKENRKDDTFE
jgi:hypothetical protein